MKNTKEAKLSPTQKKVLDLMGNGWELAVSYHFRTDASRAWLQKGGAGCGGDVEYTTNSTVRALEARKLIVLSEKKAGINTVVYRLPEKSKSESALEEVVAKIKEGDVVRKTGRPRLGAEPSELVSLRFPGETVRRMTEEHGSPEEALRYLVEAYL